MSRGHRAGRALGLLLLALLLAACGGGQDAVDVPSGTRVTSPTERDPSAPPAVTAARAQPATAPAAPAAQPATPSAAPAAPAAPATPTNGRNEQPADAATVNGWSRIGPDQAATALSVGADGLAILAAAPGGGLLTRDGGTTWTAIDWPGEARGRAAIDPTGQNIVVPGVGNEPAALWSADAGQTWAEAAAAVRDATYNGDDVFLGADPAAGIVLLGQGGTSVTLVVAAEALAEDGYALSGVFPHPTDYRRFVIVSADAAGSERLAYTDSTGQQRTPILPDLLFAGRVAVAWGAIGPVVFNERQGVLMTFDRGARWYAQNQGLAAIAADGAYGAIVDLAVLPVSGLPVVATADGLYAFDPTGWKTLPAPPGPIHALATAGANGVSGALLAATESGIWAIAEDALIGG